MSDETNAAPTGDAPSTGGDQGAVTPPAGDQTPQSGDTTPPAGEQTPAGDNPPSGDQTPEGGETPPANDQPPVRKTRSEYIKERQDAKAKKDAEGGDGNAQIHPDDAAIVDQIIQSKYGDSLDKINDQAIRGEITEFVQTNPQFKGHEKKIEAYAKHSAYSKLPIEQAAYAAVGKDLMKAGADGARAADKEAAETATGGGSTRDMGGGKVDYSKMSNADMEIAIMKAKGQV